MSTNPEFIDRPPLVGGFNSNHFVRHGREPGNPISLLRIPYTNKDLMANIIEEYRVLGFTGDGGRVRRRTTEEQHVFSRQAFEAGLKVLPPIQSVDRGLHYPYLAQPVSLDRYFQQTSDDNKRDRLILDIFTDLRQAHSKGFFYSDRWAGNMLVDPPTGRLTHIDFDLELTGPTVREFETAQVAYHTLWAAGEESTQLIAYMVGRQSPWLNLDKVAKYLRGFAKFLNETPVGRMEEAVEGLIIAAHSTSLDNTQPMRLPTLDATQPTTLPRGRLR